MCGFIQKNFTPSDGIIAAAAYWHFVIKRFEGM
jgi:hypothetical protein